MNEEPDFVILEGDEERNAPRIRITPSPSKQPDKPLKQQKHQRHRQRKRIRIRVRRRKIRKRLHRRQRRRRINRNNEWNRRPPPEVKSLGFWVQLLSWFASFTFVQWIHFGFFIGLMITLILIIRWVYKAYYRNRH